jgi:transposase
MSNDTILMDNAIIHRTVEVKEFLKDNNIKTIYNVPYSPQFNPIELVINVIKGHVKNLGIMLILKNN